MIFNPKMELVYANPSAENLAGRCALILAPQGENSHLDVIPIAHCEPCPGKQLFEDTAQNAGQIASIPSVSTTAKSHCPLPRAIPLREGEGMVQFAELMGSRGRESVVLGPEEMIQRVAAGRDFRTPERGFTKEIIGNSLPIQRLVEMIQLVAASDASVLIQGESGTGKELVAKTIHVSSHRRECPFVVVECSALPETLLESELFGHVRGAFTGAVADRKGLFEEAEGGTIFLDEIADTSHAFQARLLRVLQEGEIKPVGSNRSVNVNVRVISAGNRPLEDLVAGELFRSDLYYRLAVLPLTVPPLRERKEDIPMLAAHFLAQSLTRHGREQLQLSHGAQQALLRHPWPGNIRELENMIERAVVTCTHHIIEVPDLFADSPEESLADDLGTIGKLARQEAERSRILHALREAEGDKSRAARALSISRSSLYNKLRAYKIS